MKYYQRPIFKAALQRLKNAQANFVGKMAGPAVEREYKRAYKAFSKLKLKG